MLQVRVIESSLIMLKSENEEVLSIIQRMLNSYHNSSYHIGSYSYRNSGRVINNNLNNFHERRRDDNNVFMMDVSNQQRKKKKTNNLNNRSNRNDNININNERSTNNSNRHKFTTSPSLGDFLSHNGKCENSPFLMIVSESYR